MHLTYHRLPWILRYMRPSQREFRPFPGTCKHWTYRRWPSSNTSASPSRYCGRGRRGSSGGCSGWWRGGGTRRVGPTPLSHIAADVVPFTIWEAIREKKLRNILCTIDLRNRTWCDWLFGRGLQKHWPRSRREIHCQLYQWRAWQSKSEEVLKNDIITYFPEHRPTKTVWVDIIGFELHDVWCIVWH